MSTRWPRTYWFSSCGGFFSWLIADRFSIVAVKIENEGLIVAWMVLGAKPGSTVVMPARRDGRLEEGINGCVGSERDMEGLARPG
jgi:hypothetical protein